MQIRLRTCDDIAKRLAPRIARDYSACQVRARLADFLLFFFRAKKRLAARSKIVGHRIALSTATRVVVELRSSVADGRRGSPRRGGLRNRPVFSRGASASRRRKRRRRFMNYDRLGRGRAGPVSSRRAGKADERERERERERARARIRARRDGTPTWTARKAPRNVTYARAYKAFLAVIRNGRAARKRKRDVAGATPRRSRDGVATPAGGTPGAARKISGGKTHRCYASCGLCQLRSSRAKRLSGGRDVTRAARARGGPRPMARRWRWRHRAAPRGGAPPF